MSLVISDTTPMRLGDVYEWDESDTTTQQDTDMSGAGSGHPIPDVR